MTMSKGSTQKWGGGVGSTQEEGLRTPQFSEVSPSRQPFWGRLGLLFIWTREEAGLFQKGFIRLSWEVQLWVGGEEGRLTGRRRV